jgi:S-adenosylmethionine decarboxylase
MRNILIDLLFTLCMINAQCMDSPRNDLSPRCSEPVPIYDVEGITVQHLAADFHQCIVPYGSEAVEAILREAAKVAGATALEFSYHKFSPDGVSAVLILGESHISVHYWYEKHYALIDIVTCGSCEPYAAIDLLSIKFNAVTITIHDISRPFK